MSSISNEKKLKYMTFALLGTVLLGAIVPQANATSDISQLTQQILNIVKSTVYGNQAIKNAVDTKASQTSVNGLQTTANLIDANTVHDRPLVKIINRNITLAHGAFKLVDILPYNNAFIYHGHISIDTDNTGLQTGVAVNCHMTSEDLFGIEIASLNTYSGPLDANNDFACRSINLEQWNDESTDENSVVHAVIEYKLAEIDPNSIVN